MLLLTRRDRQPLLCSCGAQARAGEATLAFLCSAWWQEPRFGSKTPFPTLPSPRGAGQIAQASQARHGRLRVNPCGALAYPQSPLEESHAQDLFRGLDGPKGIFLEGHGVRFARVSGPETQILYWRLGVRPTQAWPARRRSARISEGSIRAGSQTQTVHTSRCVRAILAQGPC